MTGSSDAPQDQGRIAGLEGNDQIDGGAGNDALHGDEGNDTIRDDSGALDVDAVNCEPGTKDNVVFDGGLDTIHKSCEIRTAG